MGDAIGRVVTDATDDGPGPGLWIGLALGTPVMLYGAYELVQQAGWPRTVEVATWLGGGLLVHDLVLVPFVLVVVWALGRITRPALGAPLRAGVLGSGLVVAVAWPALRGYGDRPDNATVHPLDYGSAVLTALALLWGAVAAWCVVAFLRRRRVRPSA
jgi:hypothetical protein